MGHALCVFTLVRCVEKEFPGGGKVVLKKWSFPVRADRQDVPAALPALSPLRWKGRVGQVVGRLTRQDAAFSSNVLTTTVEGKEVRQGASTRTHATRFPRLTISGEGAQTCDAAATGKTLTESVSHDAVVLQLFRYYWWLRQDGCAYG
jgi:hypothetical protein